MNSLRNTLFFTFLLLISSFFITSCNKDEPCDDVVCPTGYLCDDGTCEPDPDADACLNVNCPTGFSCVDGDCIEDNPQAETVVLSGTINSNMTLTADKYYELATKVVVTEGVTLTIEPGTIIKGREGIGSLATALIIARGGKIEACGTADKPIIFTSVLDNIEIGQTTGTNLSETNNELWGGLIVLGSAPISAKDGDTEAQIEGVPADNGYGTFGGHDPADNSGSLCYVSIRHGGALIGADNEINGLTLGGVGNGTTINNIEVVANLDDGVEFFGGTVDATNIIVTYQGDDAIDIDMNYSGTVNNFMVIHGGSDTDEALEIDGPEGSTYTDGLFTLINGTCIALDTEKTSGGDFKSKAQGKTENVIWKGYSKFVKVRASFDPDNACSSKSDAYSNAVEGKLTFISNEVVSTIVGMEDIANVYPDDDEGEPECFALVETEYQTILDDAVKAADNRVVDSASKGADKTAFTGWTWSDAKGFIQ